MVKETAATIPVFKLYGGDLGWPTPDLLHCESIPERSRLHDWEIRPHRHGDLTQLLYLRRGEARIEIEGTELRIDYPAVQVIPPLVIHGFRFSTDVDGYIVTLAAPLLASLRGHLGEQETVLSQPGLYPASANEQRYIDTLFTALADEYTSAVASSARDLQLQSLVALQAVWLCRKFAEQRNRVHGSSVARGDRSNECFARFTRMIEEHFRSHWSVDEYARRLDISTVHLNTICRRLHGKTALGVLHERLLLEANRNLVYTTLTVNQIADLLGFSEPAYFTRFFKRLAGATPREFRSRHAARSTPSG